MTPANPSPTPGAGEPGLEAARAALVERRQGFNPPGGFDAWLHLLAAPVPAHGAAGGPVAEEVWVATASLTAPNDPTDPLALFFIAPARVEVALRRLLESLAGDAGGQAGHRGEPGQAVPRGQFGKSAQNRQHSEHEQARQRGEPGQAGRAPGGGPLGWFLQVGASGMQFRTLAEPPAGFVPRYRLPRRAGEEPVWAPEEPLWCPHRRLVAETAGVARQLAEELARRLE